MHIRLFTASNLCPRPRSCCLCSGLCTRAEGGLPSPCCVHSLCCVPGRPQRSNQWVMCPDYNQLPKGHLQRAPEEMERGSSIALHGVITSWGSIGSTLFLGRVGLKDRPLNDSVRPVSAVGGTSNCWSPAGGACHPNLYKSSSTNTHKVVLEFRQCKQWMRSALTKGKVILKWKWWTWFKVWDNLVHAFPSQENKLMVWVFMS